MQPQFGSSRGGRGGGGRGRGDYTNAPSSQQYDMPPVGVGRGRGRGGGRGGGGDASSDSSGWGGPSNVPMPQSQQFDSPDQFDAQRRGGVVRVAGRPRAGAQFIHSGGRPPMNEMNKLVEVFHKDQQPPAPLMKQPLGNTEFGQQQTPTGGRGGSSSGRAGRAGRFNVSGVQPPTAAEDQVPVEQPKPPTVAAPMQPPPEPQPPAIVTGKAMNKSPAFDPNAAVFRPVGTGYPPYRRPGNGANVEDDTASVLSAQPPRPVTPGPGATPSASTDNNVTNLMVQTLDEMGAHFLHLGNHFKSMADGLRKGMVGGGK